MLQIIFAVILISLLYHFLRNQLHNQKKKTGPNPLPPGPKPLPIIGNLAHLPPRGIPEYQYWLRFKDKYGPISSITVLGTSLIIIHDRQAAHDLFEKSSSKTSSRPQSQFGGSLCGFEAFLTFKQYDATFRRQRKLVHQLLGTKASVGAFREVLDAESVRFLVRVLEEPGSLIKHIKTEASAIILKIVYGYSVEPRRPDPLVLLIERMMQNLSLAFVSLDWPVNYLPVLRYLPEGLPGSSFKTVARRWKKVTDTVIETPYAFVRQQMAKGVHQLSYVASALEQLSNTKNLNDNNQDSENENTIKSTAAVMYAGGADTTVSTLSGFVLAMILFPEVQRKAQREIDTVIGTDRLPRFEDRPDLPYVNAVVKESLRWQPVVPLSVPHVADEEIIYAGFRIPKGAYLIPSIWWFLHDPATYSDPSAFDPDRYLEPRNEPDPASEAFGYGRRICPGRYLADESMFLTISRLLATFNIIKAVDGQKKEEIEPEIKISPGLIGHVLDFPCDIKPRSDMYADLVRNAEIEHPWEEGSARLLAKEFTENYAGMMEESAV